MLKKQIEGREESSHQEYERENEELQKKVIQYSEKVR